MRFYEITIIPTSGFGTPLKGDTIFGSFCWQAEHDPTILEGGLKKQIVQYPEKPFAIFSSAFIKLKNSLGCYALRRPEMPLSMMFSAGKNRMETIRAGKENKKRSWMTIGKDGYIDLREVNFITEAEVCEKIAESAANRYFRHTEENPEEITILSSQAHNTINRITGATGIGFTPYSKENTYYLPETKLAVFVLIDENATDIEKVVRGVKKIGIWGFGRDASIGMGRFTVEQFDELTVPKTEDARACYTLAPSVPDMALFEESYFNPFVRFGKHGEHLANGKNPFKNPVIMADESAVFVPKDRNFFERPYLGRAVTGISKAMPGTVIQGYTPYLPLKLEQAI